MRVTFSKIVLLLVLATFMAGCSSLKTAEKPAWMPAAFKSEKKEQELEGFGEPAKIAAIWTDSVYEKAGAPPVRGFGARVFLIDAAGKPVRAKGELAVYGYDESSESGSDRADQKFVFRETEFQTHYGETDIGHSYSVWVPWEKVGGIRKSVALIPVFRTASGNVIRGEQSINVLPGRTPERKMELVGGSSNETMSNGLVRTAAFESSPDQRPVQTAGYENRTDHGERDRYADGTSENSSVRTTTISLPRHLASRISEISPNREDENLMNRIRVTTVKDGETATPLPRSEPQVQEAQLPQTDSSKPVFGKPGEW